MSFSDQEIEEFKAESLELLEVAEKSLLALDQGAEYRSSFDSIFRGFHNLKGAAGLMELLKLQSHTHELETILMEFKDASSMPPEYINFFLRGVDAAKLLLAGGDAIFEFNIKKKDEVSVPEAQMVQAVSEPLDIIATEFFAECDEIVDRLADALQLVESQQHTKETIEGLYRDIHSLKGSAYLFSFNELGDVSHKMESSLEKVREGTHLTSKPLIDELFKCIKFIEKEIHCLKTKTKNDQTESVLPFLLKSLDLAAAHLPQQLGAAKELIAPEVPPVKEKDAEVNSSIRVSVALLDNLMTLMGEMVLVRNQVIQFSSKSDDLEFLTLSKRLNVVTSEIQGEMMKTRMQPIGNILNKFNRVVRDLSQELKKEINLNLSGADTELDKSLLEAIKDPLTHIVRNSCDHGIEKPEVRTQNGKEKNGTISIRSYHEGGQVVIEVRDDGKGLHKDVLLKKALEKSIVTQSQAANMTEKEIFNLIFAPGFSTAANVTNVSGRGVGMDVVRTNVERIGGSVELTSIAGKGTTTKLKIPLTLAIVPALIIKCGGGTFAIPQVKLEELVRVDQSSTENKIEFLHGAPVYRLRDNILPLVSLNKILGLTSVSSDPSTVSNIAVLNADQCSFGLIVDEVQDTADIVVKPINRLLKSLQVFSGATILGDGSIAPILDVYGISKVTQIGNDASKGDELARKRAEEKKAAEANEFQEFLLVKINSPTKHAIVLGYVHRLEEFKTSRIEYSGSQRLIRYGDSILPIISVSEQLGLVEKGGEKALEKMRETIPVVVIQKGGVLYGLEVDEIIDTLSTDIEVSPSFVKQVGVFGNLNTPDELIVAIDPFELIHKVSPESNLTVVVTPSENKLVPAETVNAGPLNILLVEDTVFFRKAIARVLTDAGNEVVSAIDGKDGFEILEKNPKKFDLVVSDIEMPRMNGFELAKAIRGNPQLSYLPMLAISSRADKNYVSKGVAAGFNVYLEKLKPDILLGAVAKLTQSRRRVG